MPLIDLTIKELHEGYKKKQFTATEVVRAYLDHIKAVDPKIGAYLSVDEEGAMAQAEQADKIIATQKEYPILTGIPCSIKDLILVERQKCTAGSKILENYVAPYDATVITKLKRAGAIILGKVNLDEFAMGSSTENSAFKVTKNPHDLSRVPGGTSGGSAASVAAGMAAFSLGTDTGGSIRQPASFCGVVGLRATYGSVSRYGVVADASSLDQVGPLAKNVEDAKLAFEVISGKDPLDATSADYVFKDTEIEMKKIKIGVPKEYFSKGLDKEVEVIIKNAIAKAKAAGAKIIPISLPHSEFALACYYIIQTSEASANLARYDGIKYGLSEKADNLLGTYLKSRGAGFGAEVKRRIMTGTYSLSSGYYDAYYKKAQQVRELIKQDFVDAFKKVDVIFAPVSPFPAFKIGENTGDPLSMYLADIYTVPINLAYLPGLSVPAGKIGNPEKGQSPHGAGLPVGLQIIGNHFEENKILAVAQAMEKMLT